MKRFIVAVLLLLFTTQANAAILVMSQNGTYTTATDLCSAGTRADVANKTVVVTSALSSTFSNISSNTCSLKGVWPSDRALKVEKGGSIGNTTKFSFNDSTVRPVEWFGIDTAGVNRAIAASSISFTAATYALAGDIIIPANRKIYIGPNTTVTNTGGRFTAYDVDNVEFEIDGVLSAVATTQAAEKSGWQTGRWVDVAATRGFIEFGSADIDVPRSGFLVHGKGKIHGDWTGTPNASQVSPGDWQQVNFKGIAAWNSSDVTIKDIEVYGFSGEAVYANAISENMQNILFENLYVHDTRFNALNFNVAPRLHDDVLVLDDGLARFNNWVIKNCRTYNSYAGIEMSVGTAENNYIDSAVVQGIWYGAGGDPTGQFAGGAGPLRLLNNIVVNCGTSYLPLFNYPPIGPVQIEGNVSINSEGTAYGLGQLKDLIFANNVSIGNAQLYNDNGKGYAFGISNCTNGSVTNNIRLSPGANSVNPQFVLITNTNVSTDFQISPDASGTFTPVLTGFTIVGTSTYVGNYTKRGNRVFCTIQIIPTTSIASTAITSYITGMPYTVAINDVATVSDDSITDYPTGAVINGSSRVYTPTWTARSALITISFSYITGQ
jgi:hypothetical protein